MSLKRSSSLLCLCCPFFHLLYSLLFSKLSLRLSNGLLPYGWPRVKTMPSSRPPLNLIEGFEKFPRGVSIVPFCVCCSVQIETVQYFDLTFRNNSISFFREDLLNILGSEECPAELASSPRE